MMRVVHESGGGGRRVFDRRVISSIHCDSASAYGLRHDLLKTAITAVLPKPNKPNYSNPGAYLPIQLLECLDKLPEKIVASRITFDIGKHVLIPPLNNLVAGQTPRAPTQAYPSSM